MTESRSADHFRRIYANGSDPWNFETSAYEQEKYRTTLAALDQPRFTAGLEVGCSIGILTRMLSDRCETILGIDLLEEPLDTARKRNIDRPSIHFEAMQVPQSWPRGRFDLIVFSEVLYFFNRNDMAACAAHTRQSVFPNATIILVNWLGETGDPCTGEEAAETFIAAGSGWLRRETTQRNPGYRLDVLKASTP
jgi:cyclopropane fatty-acyl-phospholipid synthase-like methyltransferase